MSNLTATVPSSVAAAPAAPAITATTTPAAGSLFKRCGTLVDALTTAAGRVVAVVVDVVRDACAAVARTADRAVGYLVELTGWTPRTVHAVAFVVVVLLLLALGYVRRSGLA